MSETIINIGGAKRRVVSEKDWQAAQDEIRLQEKALTKAHDALAAQRRRAPLKAVDKPYRFNGVDGAASLLDLFDGRRQLITYHHMLKPQDPDPCSGCGMVGDQIPHLSHLNQRDTTFVFVSKAPIAEIELFKKRMGWSVPWYETVDDFNADHGVNGGFGVNVFIREGGDIYHSYFTTGRGAETLGTVWTLLDLTPLGRQETWEDSPEGAPQTPPYQWWRLHDEYSDARSVSPADCAADTEAKLGA